MVIGVLFLHVYYHELTMKIMPLFAHPVSNMLVVSNTVAKITAMPYFTIFGTFQCLILQISELFISLFCRV